MHVGWTTNHTKLFIETKTYLKYAFKVRICSDMCSSRLACWWGLPAAMRDTGEKLLINCVDKTQWNTVVWGGGGEGREWRGKRWNNQHKYQNVKYWKTHRFSGQRTSIVLPKHQLTQNIGNMKEIYGPFRQWVKSTVPYIILTSYISPTKQCSSTFSSQHH